MAKKNRVKISINPQKKVADGGVACAKQYGDGAALYKQ
jgi:hypothetical protein